MREEWHEDSAHQRQWALSMKPGLAGQAASAKDRVGVGSVAQGANIYNWEVFPRLTIVDTRNSPTNTDQYVIIIGTPPYG